MTLSRVLAISCAVVVLYGAVLAWGSRAAFPARLAEAPGLPSLADKPLGEDGFYMLTVAWNLGHGRGLTYNDGIETTGIQPLATVLYGGLAAGVRASGGTRWDLARLVLLFGVGTVVGLALLLGALARASLPAGADPERAALAFFLGAVLTLANVWVFRIATYGLETGVYLVLLAAFAGTLVRDVPRMTVRRAAVAGLLAGLCGLARIDFGVLLALFLALLVVRRVLTLRHGIVLGATALALVAPWFLWVHAVSGHWAPSSGPAQSSWITAGSAPGRVLAMAKAVLNHLTPWLYTGNRLDLTLLALLSVAVVGALLVWARRTTRPAAPDRAWADVLSALGLAVVGLVGVYLVLFRSTHFYDRYAAPLLVVVIPGLAWLVATSVPVERLRRAAVPLAAGLGLAAAFWFAVTLHRGATGNVHAVTAGFVQAHYPEARVGAFQSGVVGYFNPNVVNLDGKVDARALAAAQAGKLEAFLDAQGVDVLVDAGGNLHRIDMRYLAEHWRRCSADPPNDYTLCLERLRGHVQAATASRLAAADPGGELPSVHPPLVE